VDEQLHAVTTGEAGENHVADDLGAPVATELPSDPASPDELEVEAELTVEAGEDAEPALRKRGFLAEASSGAALLIAALSWIVPGLGHLLMRRWQRGLAFFVAVGGLAVAGYLMRGNVFPLGSKDPFGTLGFLADASSGIFYLLAHTFEKTGPNVARAMGDYGTRFIAGAGIVNLLGVCDAYEVARGRRR
jgi:Family of unknown function (DUF6677)